MRDRKYRIKEVVDGLGESTYYPQYKDLLFWNYVRDEYGDKKGFSNKEGAERLIKGDYIRFRRSQVSKENLQEYIPKV